MKINIITSVARQIDGEYVFLKIEGAYVDSAKADFAIQDLKKSMTKDGKVVPVVLNVNNEKIECLMEIGIQPRGFGKPLSLSCPPAYTVGAEHFEMENGMSVN